MKLSNLSPAQVALIAAMDKPMAKFTRKIIRLADTPSTTPEKILLADKLIQKCILLASTVKPA